MDVKERIQEKANELFRKYGVKSITMDDIASQLGISKKTIYQYFADKEELVHSVIDQKIKESQGDCTCSISDAENAIHEQFLVQDKFLEHLSELNPVALHDMEKFHPSAYEKFSRHRNTFIREMVEKNLRTGIGEGLYRPGLRTDILSKFRVDSIYLGLSADFMGSAFGLAELHQELFVHYLFGIASPEGNKLIHRYLLERQKPVVSVTPHIGKTGS
jgi:TetR/AcrR family transcriptional regulator, cholesterol catabolism regulator